MSLLRKIVLLALLVTALMTSAGNATPFFVDVPGGHIFRDDINWLAETGITKGCNPPANDRFCPDASVTRGQMAAFLARALNLTDDGGGNSFTDDDTSPFEADIATTAAAGITKGCNPPANDRFCPDARVTRGQIAAFLHRSSDPLTSGPTNQFWEWGWGWYNPDVPIDVQAVFDWSTVNFGTVHPGQDTLDRLNEILEINPDHKFLVRVWPNPDIGIDPHLPTMFEFLYEPGVREAVLAEAREQVSFVLDGIAKPENVVGFTFIEELPLHFTTDRDTLGWQRGQTMPWDIAQFEPQINAELGEPIDMGIESHRLWWGQKYTETLGEIHDAIKQASGGMDVFIWHQANFRTLDMLEPGESMFQSNVIPIYYRDIIKPGLVDGIFGYPNSEAVWNQRTLNIAEGFDVPFWSQLSAPGYMRILEWDETLDIATQGHPGNLGALLYAEPSTGAGIWNRMPYEDGVKLWSPEDHARMLLELLVNP